MKKSILAICIFILVVCLLSCDVNAFNELLGRTRERFLKTNRSEKNLHSIKEIQESRVDQTDVIMKSEKGGTEPSRTSVLTNEQEYELYEKEAKVNDINKKVDVILMSLGKTFEELNQSLSEFENIEAYIVKAKSDFESSQRSSVNVDLKINLDKAIKQITSSKHLAVVGYKDKLSTLSISRADAEYSKGLVKSALGESEQARSSGYYYVQRMIDNIAKAEKSLSDAESMFKRVESELGKLRSDRQKVNEDFAGLKSVHEALVLDKK